MNTTNIIIVVIVMVIMAGYFLWLRPSVRIKKVDAKKKADVEKAQAIAKKLAELRIVAQREKVNFIEFVWSVDSNLVNEVSLDDVLALYHPLPDHIKQYVKIHSDMCSTFQEFWSLALRGFSLTEVAVEKMYRLCEFWSMHGLWSEWHRERGLFSSFPNEKIFNRVYKEKFSWWLANVQTCAEIARLPSWRLNCDLVTSWEWEPACNKFVWLCRKEMWNCNDLPTLWRLRRNARTCSYYDVFIVEKELFQKILSLTHDLNELKRLANPQTYEDRVETDESTAKRYYIETVQSILLKCRSVEELRVFLNSHEIPSEAKSLSLKLMAELPEIVSTMS